MKVTRLCPTLRPQALYSPWNSPGKNTGVGGLSLLQGIFPTQGSNPGLPHRRRTLHLLGPEGTSALLSEVELTVVITAGRPPVAVGRMDRGKVHIPGGRFWEAGGNADTGQPPDFQIQLGRFQEGTQVAAGVSSLEFSYFNVYLL